MKGVTSPSTAATFPAAPHDPRRLGGMEQLNWGYVRAARAFRPALAQAADPGPEVMAVLEQDAEAELQALFDALELI